MSVPGVIQATLFAKKAPVEGDNTWSLSSMGEMLGFSGPIRKQRLNWNVPIWILPQSSEHFRAGFPAEQYGNCVIHSRIGNSLGLKTGDDIDLEVQGEKFTTKVVLIENDEFDLVIDAVNADGFGFRIAKLQKDAPVSELLLKEGECTLEITHQDMFKATTIGAPMGGIILEFTAIEKNGISGYGFCIHSSIDTDNCMVINQLVMGRRNCGDSCSQNEAHYAALVEGLIWASRLKTKKLWVCGVSHFVISQLVAHVEIQTGATEEPYYHRAFDLLEKIKDSGALIEILHVEDSVRATKLASKALGEKSVVVECNWKNINKQMTRLG